jgi:hypothetical protein
MTLRKFLLLAFEPDHALEVIEALAPKLLKTSPLKLRLDQAYHVADVSGMDPVEFVHLIIERRCRKCGCTQDDCSKCIERTGQPCHWVKMDLCSACIPASNSTL